MRLCIVNPFYDPDIASGTELISRYRHLAQLGGALARRGLQVVVTQAFRYSEILECGPITYQLVRTPLRSIASLSGDLISSQFVHKATFTDLVRTVADVDPDVVHMNGLTLLEPLAALASWCIVARRPLTVTHHGGEPRRAPWLRGYQRRILACVDRVFFSTASHAHRWLAAGLLQPEQVMPCMEVSSEFAPVDRRIARTRTGMQGFPVFCSSARLHPNKDPVTALKGFSIIRRMWPEARLYMTYLTNEMRFEVERTIKTEPRLSGAVEMRGRIPHAAVEDFINSSDFLIQASIREPGCSFAVLEAMACGVIPVVTDIPAFRAMTSDGRLGVLFPVGNHTVMAARVLDFGLGELHSKSRHVRDFFVGSLSYDVIAKTYEIAFLSALNSPAHSRHVTPGLV